MKLCKKVILYEMQITSGMIFVGLIIILFEVFPEESLWSVPVREADEHIIAVPISGGLTSLLEAYKTLTKEQQRFWKRILIVDDEADLTITFNALSVCVGKRHRQVLRSTQSFDY